MFGFGSSAPKPLNYPESPSPKTPEEFTKLSSDILAEFNKCVESTTGWTPVEVADAPGVTLEDFAGESTSTCLRVTTVVSKPVKDVFDFVNSTDESTIRSWDADLQTMKVHKKLTDNSSIIFAGHNAPFPVTNRAVVTLKVEDAANFVTAQKSINSDDFPEDSNFVRAVANITGFKVLPVEGDDTKAKLVRVVNLDPKGSIPGWVVSMKKTQAATKLVVLRQAIEKK